MIAEWEDMESLVNAVDYKILYTYDLGSNGGVQDTQGYIDSQ